MVMMVGRNDDELPEEVLIAVTRDRAVSSKVARIIWLLKAVFACSRTCEKKKVFSADRHYVLKESPVYCYESLL